MFNKINILRDSNLYFHDFLRKKFLIKYYHQKKNEREGNRDEVRVCV